MRIETRAAVSFLELRAREFDISHNLKKKIPLIHFMQLFIACLSGTASVLQVGERAELISPGYPYAVPEDLGCRWLLEASIGQV